MTGGKMLRIEDVSLKTGLEQGCIRSRMHKGVFPEGIKIGKYRYWPEKQIDDYLKECTAERREKAELFTWDGACAYLHYSESKLRVMHKNGEFPRGRRLRDLYTNRERIFFTKEELDEWQARQAMTR